mmetsp:Transcript_58272/g.104001  ORF Transcript_58272/g.104001 Transcript_58272/m.104001 type:complete len:125 (-) Transcript_58272:335-709(-)
MGNTACTPHSLCTSNLCQQIIHHSKGFLNMRCPPPPPPGPLSSYPTSPFFAARKLYSLPTSRTPLAPRSRKMAPRHSSHEHTSNEDCQYPNMKLKPIASDTIRPSRVTKRVKVGVKEPRDLGTH